MFLFPVGLIAPFLPSNNVLISAALVVGAYAIYVIILIVFIGVNKPKSFFYTLAVYAFVILLTVIGWRITFRQQDLNMGTRQVKWPPVS
jgi:hypothetical protein